MKAPAKRSRKPKKAERENESDNENGVEETDSRKNPEKLSELKMTVIMKMERSFDNL